jgi:hypothetical protein
MMCLLALALQNVGKSNVYVWLGELHIALAAKFYLCFQTVLGDSLQAGDMRILSTKLALNYLVTYAPSQHYP